MWDRRAETSQTYTTILRALGQIRTGDTRFRKPVLYPLSYEGAETSV